MKISFSITSLAIASLFLWANYAQASANTSEECPMMKKMSQATQTDMESHTSPGPQKPPAQSGHSHGIATNNKELDSALKNATQNGDTCRLRGAHNICPLMGRSLLRHGPCCAAQCSPAPLKSKDPSTAQSTASPALKAGMNAVYPALMAIIARPVNLPAYLCQNEGPEPRPPTC